MIKLIFSNNVLYYFAFMYFSINTTIVNITEHNRITIHHFPAKWRWMIILNRCPSLSSETIQISQEKEKKRKNSFVSAKAIPFNTLMGFLMRKGCMGRSIMDSSERLCYIYMSASRRQSWLFFFFLILLTCFNFPGPVSDASPLPQQPCESFPFDFFSYLSKKKSVFIY